MMEKLAQAGEAGGVHGHPTPFLKVTITYKVEVCAPAELTDTLQKSVVATLCVLCVVTRFFFCARRKVMIVY
jgi:hypothetical protein